MKKLRVVTLLLGIMLLVSSSAFGLNIVTKEVKFNDDPVEILDTWAHLKEENYGKDLYCFVEYMNRSENTIDALSFRMLFYDVFNEYLDSIGISFLGQIKSLIER